MITLSIWLTVALSLPAGAIAAAHVVAWLTSGGGGVMGSLPERKPCPVCGMPPKGANDLSFLSVVFWCDCRQGLPGGCLCGTGPTPAEAARVWNENVANFRPPAPATAPPPPDPVTPRRWWRYGASLIGLCHGHEGKPADLPLIMATERSDFGDARFRLWRVGHLHRKGEWVSEHSGVRICTAPSLAARDHWHAAQGYGHLRSMEAHVWHREHGPVGQFTASVPALVAA